MYKMDTKKRTDLQKQFVNHAKYYNMAGLNPQKVQVSSFS